MGRWGGQSTGASMGENPSGEAVNSDILGQIALRATNSLSTLAQGSAGTYEYRYQRVPTETRGSTLVDALGFSVR